MKHVCIVLIRFYRKFLSPLKSQPCCRFTPSCSTYGLEAFQKRGFFVGMILTVSRIFRCNPFCPGGYDPVPLKGLRHKRDKDGRIIFNDCNSSCEGFVFNYDLKLEDCEKESTEKIKRED